MTIWIRVDVGRLSSFAALSIAARTRVSKRTDVMTPDPALPTLAVFFGALASVADQAPTIYAVWGGGATPAQALYMVGLILPPKTAAV
jgi:hypothetical protein